MPRRPRHLESNVVYHIYNRRTDKQCLFDSDDAYAYFVTLLKTANERYAVRLHAFCLMTTHWHLALSAEDAPLLSRYAGWISTKQAIHLRRVNGTIGQGHVYQDRFQAVPADGILHYVTLIRYIEANPRAARLVTRAEEWRWSSLCERLAGQTSLIQAGPWQLPSMWSEIVNTPEIKIELLAELSGQIASFRPAPIAFH